MQANYVQRLRLTFAKLGPTRYIGHLDLARALERSLSRAQVPLAYTQGYNPRPRMQLAAALPLGFTSECEMADIWLLETVDPEATRQSMAEKTAPGIDIKEVCVVELSEPALQNTVSEAIYTVTVSEAIDRQRVLESISLFLAEESVMRERRGKEYDLRPLVFDLTLEEGNDKGKQGTQLLGEEIALQMRLSMKPGMTGRPDEVLAALGLDPLAAHIHRGRLILANA